MPFLYPRQIRFHETDGAGVVYFANVLTLCHEAYEASLEASRVELASFFSPLGTVIPIIHGAVDFFRPMGCGDRITISLSPCPIAQAAQPLSEFQIDYRLFTGTVTAATDAAATDAATTLARATTRHCCISSETRRRQPLPEDVHRWLNQWQHPPC